MINRIDEYYYKQIYKIKMKSREKVSDYYERFDAIVREYQSMEDSEFMLHSELSAAFDNKIVGAVPEIEQTKLNF